MDSVVIVEQGRVGKAVPRMQKEDKRVMARFV